MYVRHRSPRRLIGSLLASACAAFVGCASAPPSAAITQYRTALASKDAEAVAAVSDDASRRAYGTEAVERALQEGGDPVDQVITALSSGVVSVEETAWVELENGHRVRLVREAGEWRVASGGLQLARADQPETALATLFASAAAGRLNDVRRVMPKRFVEAYGDDAHLTAHLEEVRPRLEEAKTLIGPLVPGRATIEGEQASLSYADGRIVRFEREEGDWRVLDLE